MLVTCDAGNAALRPVIEANGGVAAGEEALLEHPGERRLLYWVATAP